MLRRKTPRAIETGGFHVLQRRPPLTVWQSLAMRAVLVFGLISIALLGHWLDRDGLKDNLDGHISFTDVLYFTAITVTTTGYGDIVPVTDAARLFDAFVVTPVRVFIWLIFLGTAYDFVFKRTFERIRTAMIRQTLSGHTIICGFGASGEFAARELLCGGTPLKQIVVIDPIADRVAAGVALGLSAIQGDATQNDALNAACIATAKAVLVATSKDDAAALVVLSARQLNATVPISVTARAQENEDLFYQAGATFVLNPVRIGGHLLARAGTQHHAVSYLADLASAEGDVLLRQRTATNADIGKTLRTLASGHALRLLRAGVVVDDPGSTIEAGDMIIEIVADSGNEKVA